MTILDGTARFRAAQRMAKEEREHPGWCAALKRFKKLIYQAEEEVGPHPGVLPTVDRGSTNVTIRTPTKGFKPHIVS